MARKVYPEARICLGSVVNQIGYMFTVEGIASIMATIINIQRKKWAKSPCLTQPAMFYTRYNNVELPTEEKTIPEDAVFGVLSGKKICSFIRLHK